MAEANVLGQQKQGENNTIINNKAILSVIVLVAVILAIILNGTQDMYKATPFIIRKSSIE
jgi:hypothetical protein